MREGFDRLKTKYWVRIDREIINYAIDELCDAEFKLWIALRGSAYDFEGSNIGQVSTTVASIRNRFNWAQGKSSQTLSCLIRKRFIKRLKRGLYYVSRTYAEVHNNELSPIQISEYKVHSNELKVQDNEQNSFKSQSYKDKESFASSPPENLSDDELERIWKEICNEDSKKGLTGGQGVIKGGNSEN